MPNLYWNTVNSTTLREILAAIMAEPLFDSFRLVGGTALSLQLGHRISVDIDLFTDVPYGSIDFDAIDTYFRQHYPYVGDPTAGPVAFGRSYFVDDDPQHAAKVDIYYTDPFIREPILVDNIRMASTEEITAMKIDVIGSPVAGRMVMPKSSASLTNRGMKLRRLTWVILHQRVARLPPGIHLKFAWTR